MKYLRTPDNCFADLEGYAFEPHYLMVDDTEGGELRLHYLDEGHPDAPIVLMLHGEPSWSYLYRKMIPVVVKAGYRVIAPDLIGFGRSDKPTEQRDYTHVRHVQWLPSPLIRVSSYTAMFFIVTDFAGLSYFCIIDNGGNEKNPLYFVCLIIRMLQLACVITITKE